MEIFFFFYAFSTLLSFSIRIKSNPKTEFVCKQTHHWGEVERIFTEDTPSLYLFVNKLAEQKVTVVHSMINIFNVNALFHNLLCFFLIFW